MLQERLNKLVEDFKHYNFAIVDLFEQQDDIEWCKQQSYNIQNMIKEDKKAV